MFLRLAKGSQKLNYLLLFELLITLVTFSDIQITWKYETNG